MPGNEALDEFDQFFEACPMNEEIHETPETPIFGIRNPSVEFHCPPMRRHSAQEVSRISDLLCPEVIKRASDTLSEAPIS